MDVCQFFNKQLQEGNINFQTSIDQVVCSLGTGQNMVGLHQEIVKHPLPGNGRTEVSFILPIYGQLFIGIGCDDDIQSVSFTIKNHTSKKTIPGIISAGMWMPFIRILPICLLDDKVNEIICHVNYNTYGNSFKPIVGYYGFLSQTYIASLYEKLVFELGSSECPEIKIVWGIFYFLDN